MWGVQKWPNTKRGPESSAPAFRKETLSATLPPRSPTQPIPSILGLAESVCQVVQGSDYCSIREGGLLDQEAGRCSCLNWPTSTESEQPGNYATDPNPFPWKKKNPHKNKKQLSLHLFTQGEKRALPKYAHEPHHWTCFILTLFVHSLCWKCPAVLFCNQLSFLLELNTIGPVW